MELLLGIILIFVLWISFDVLHILHDVKFLKKEITEIALKIEKD